MADGGGYWMELWASVLTLVTGWNYVTSKQTSKEIQECSEDHVLKAELKSLMDEHKCMLKEVRTDVKDLSKVVYKMAGVRKGGCDEED